MLFLLLFLLFKIELLFRFIRFHQNPACLTVNNGRVPFIFPVQARNADDGWNTERPSKNGSMGVAVATAQYKAEKAILIKLDGFGGGKVIRSHNDRPVSRDAWIPGARENADQPCRNIVDISAAGFHISVIHRRKHLGKLFACILYGSFRTQPLLMDQLRYSINKVEIIQHHLVGFKEAGGIVASLSTYFFSKVAKLELCSL